MRYPGQLINIHHSFLPSFIGANPYQKAFERGVKLVGATSHYVTENLDEGPIIEQDVIRVSHSCDKDDMVRLGRYGETAMLLRNEYVRSRIHRTVFSATDAFGAVGGLGVLKNEFDIVLDAISGRCTSSPLMVRELKGRTQIPIFDNVMRDLNQLSEIFI